MINLIEMANTRSAVEKAEMLEAITKILDQKIDPINEQLKKLDTIENSLDYALEEIKK